MADGDAAAAAGYTVAPNTTAANLIAALIARVQDDVANKTGTKGAAIPVAKGGTGATTAAAARTALGARATGDVPWTEVSGKPSTFAPSAHTHGGSDITSGTITRPVNTAGDIITASHVYVPNSSAAVSGYVVAYINGDGRLSKGASSERYKDDIAKLEPGDLGDIFPQLHTFVMKDDPGRMERIGYIAERLDESEDLSRFVVYAREPITEDIYEDITEPAYTEEGEFIEDRVVGRVLIEQRVVGSRRVRDENGDPIPESIDFIALLLAQVAQLNQRVAVLEAGK